MWSENSFHTLRGRRFDQRSAISCFFGAPLFHLFFGYRRCRVCGFTTEYLSRTSYIISIITILTYWRRICTYLAGIYCAYMMLLAAAAVAALSVSYYCLLPGTYCVLVHRMCFHNHFICPFKSIDFLLYPLETLSHLWARFAHNISSDITDMCGVKAGVSPPRGNRPCCYYLFTWYYCIQCR